MKKTLSLLITILVFLALISGCARKAKKAEEPAPGPGPSSNLTPTPPGPVPPYTPPGEEIEIVSATCPNTLQAALTGKELLPEEALKNESQNEWRLVSVDAHLVLREEGAIAAIATSTQLSPLTDSKDPIATVKLSCRDMLMLPQAELLSEAEFPVSIQSSSGEISRELYLKSRIFGSETGREDIIAYHSQFPTRKKLQQLFKMEQDLQAQNKHRAFKIYQPDENSLIIYTQTKTQISQKDLAYIDTAMGRYVSVPSSR